MQSNAPEMRHPRMEPTVGRLNVGGTDEELTRHGWTYLCDEQTVARNTGVCKRNPGPGLSPNAAPAARGGDGRGQPIAAFLIAREITNRWTWFVPSTICMTLASRM